jgi:hypothetical protein
MRLLTALLAACLLMSASPSFLLAADDAQPYVGDWLDQENADIRMAIAEDGGLIRIAGGDPKIGYSYTAACLVTDKKAACLGEGGKLEGKNFLYESLIIFKDDGTAVETWKAYNNLQAAEGSTTWKQAE